MFYLPPVSFIARIDVICKALNCLLNCCCTNALTFPPLPYWICKGQTAGVGICQNLFHNSAVKYKGMRSTEPLLNLYNSSPPVLLLVSNWAFRSSLVRYIVRGDSCQQEWCLKCAVHQSEGVIPKRCYWLLVFLLSLRLCDIQGSTNTRYCFPTCWHVYVQHCVSSISRLSAVVFTKSKF